MTEIWKRLTETEKEVILHDLGDYTGGHTLEFPENLIADQPVMATATARRRTPFHPWEVDLGSIEMADTLPVTK